MKVLPHHRRPPWVVSLALVAMLLVARCTPHDAEPPAGLQHVSDETGLLFLTQNVVPDAFMDALFEGRVVADRAGCLRLESPDAHTVVWPKGFGLGGDLRVRSDRGAEVGRIGGSFRLGGGEVPSLHDGVPLSEADRVRAESRCPGRFWIVGEMPR
jgi:hypothetical protein